MFEVVQLDFTRLFYIYFIVLFKIYIKRSCLDFVKEIQECEAKIRLLPTGNAHSSVCCNLTLHRIM